MKDPNQESKKIMVRIETREPVPGEKIRTGSALRITDLETGQEIENVKSVYITAFPDEIITAIITLYPAKVDLVAQAEIKEDKKE